MRCPVSPVAIRIFLYLVTILLGLSLLAGSQVMHEDPSLLVPSRVKPIDDQISTLVGGLAMSMDSISADIHAKNYTLAGQELSRFRQYSGNLKLLVSQLNISDRNYTELENSLGYIQSDMGALLEYAEQYNRSLSLYNGSLAGGDSANTSKYASELQADYIGIGSAYNRLYANATSTGEVLENLGVNTYRYRGAIDSLNEQLNQLVDTYGEVVPGERSPSLWLSASTGGVQGDTIRFKVALGDGNRSPISNARVDVFVNGSRIGTMMTGPNGNGSLDHAVAGDHPVANAVYVPADGTTPAAYSNEVALPANTKSPALTINIDRNEAQFGDIVNVFGDLKAINGAFLPGKTVDIFANGARAGSAVTHDDGSYSFSLMITPYFPAGQCVVQAAYQDDNGKSLSTGKPLNISAISAELTVLAPPIINRTDPLQVNGSLMASNGAPVEGAKILIYFDDMLAGISQTDRSGLYGLSIGMSKNALPGDHAIHSSFEPGEGKALLAASSGFHHISVAGENRPGGNGEWPFIAFAGAGILLAGAVLGVLLLATRLRGRKPAPSLQISHEVSRNRPVPDVPPEMCILSLETEIVPINADIYADCNRRAQRGIYFLAIKVAKFGGVRFMDSMTPREFLSIASRSLPAISSPLSIIVGSYEKSAYAPGNFEKAEVYLAIDCLKEIFVTLRIGLAETP